MRILEKLFEIRSRIHSYFFFLSIQLPPAPLSVRVPFGIAVFIMIIILVCDYRQSRHLMLSLGFWLMLHFFNTVHVQKQTQIVERKKTPRAIKSSFCTTG